MLLTIICSRVLQQIDVSESSSGRRIISSCHMTDLCFGTGPGQ